MEAGSARGDMDAAAVACRACLQREGELHIFREPRLLHKLRACAPLQIDEYDGLPNSLCKICVRNLDTAYNFRQLCIQSDLSLRQTFLKKKNKIRCEMRESEHQEEFDEIFVPMQIKKEEQSENSNEGTDILEKIGLSGEINVKIVNTTSFKEELKGVIIPTKKHKGNKSLTKEIKLKDNENNNGVSEGVLMIGNSDEYNFDKDNCIESDYSDETEIFNEPEDLYLLICKYCDNVKFDDDRKLKAHLAMHSKDMYDCDICRKTIKGRSRIESHKNGHTDRTQLLICEYCGLTFHKKKLRSHVRIHKESKKKECPICHRVLAFGFSYKNHIDRHEGTKKYICDICSFSSYWKSYLTRHIQKHSGKRSYKCQYCDKAFYDYSFKNEHERLHTGETPFTCPLCNKGFAQRGNMKSHFVHNHKEHNFKEEVQKAKESVDITIVRN